MAGRGLLFLVLLHCLTFLASAQEVNVASGKPANASSVYSNDYLASYVTNGMTRWSVGNCYHSADPFADNWLRVYLGAVYPMNKIVIYYRGELSGRFVGTTINILNSTDGPGQNCATVTYSDLNVATSAATFSCATAGSIVELRKDGGTQNVCEVQVFECAAKTYSTSCIACGACLNGVACDSSSGNCPAGCDPGWKGQRCDATCDAGSYGASCGQTCGNCRQTCNHVTGNCPSGCQPGWWGAQCTNACSAGSYGDGCTGQCGQCAQGTLTCDHVTGDCSGGCLPGWKAPGCRDKCDAGSYGAGCLQKCGNCTQGTKCDHVTGDCPSGCQPGWQGAKCTAPCAEGSFGAGCGQTCAQCLNGTNCNHVTGSCPSGCQPGWEDVMCSTTCQNQMYGTGCSSNCGQCLRQPCDHISGSCTGGCVTGKTGSRCDDDCPAGSFGDGCTGRCGKCLENSCGKDGRCPGLCQDGWKGDTCNMTCSAGSYGNNCSNTCGRCRDNAVCDHVTGNCPAGCEAGWNGEQCLQACINGSYGEGCVMTCGQCAGGEVCDKVDGTCTACQEGLASPLCQQASTPSALIGAAVGGSIAAIVLLVVIVGAVFLVKRRRQQKSSNRSRRLTKRKKPLSTVEDVSGYYNVALEETSASKGKPAVKTRNPKCQDEGDGTRDDVEASHYYNMGSAPRHSSEAGIPVASFPDHVKSMKAEKKFQPEYESVSSDFLKPYTVSQMKEHAGKNKFKTYYPYDDNRVVLDLVAGDPHSHYVNASHVDGFDAPKAFIAAQAPTKVTLPDFLRMIWQQHCSHVVMLANLWEEGRAKCERYFPENVGEDLTAGDITVTLAQETTASYCIVRLLTFSHKNGETRTIRQFHFTTWPDHGVPTHVDMLDFFWKVRASWTPDSGPLLVHCSAGVGRTGTFIGLCLLSDQAASQHRVDPMATLTALRHQRRNMIQTLDQYEFLHEVLERVLAFGRTAVPKTVFADHYRRLQGSTFMGTKTLDQIKQALPSLCVARKEEKFQAFDDSNVYSNTWNFQDAALHLPSVRLSSGCVQVRLCEAGQEDVAPKGLWSFLSRVSCSVLVDVHSAQKACVRQPGEEAGEVEDGALTVQWQAPAALASGVTLRSVLVKDEDKETQVTYLSYNWRKASQGLVPAVSHLCNLQLSASPSPVTFIYRDAEDERTANLLCACLNVAEAILMDSEVELVNNVLRVKATFSPEMVVQCAEFAKAFMQVTDVYANA